MVYSYVSSKCFISKIKYIFVSFNLTVSRCPSLPQPTGFKPNSLLLSFEPQLDRMREKADMAVPGRGGGALPYLEYWGRAAGQGAFLSFQLWHRVSFLSFQNWDRVLFRASNSGHPLSMYFADFLGHYQPNSIIFFGLIASKYYKPILKSLKRPWNMQYIGSNYTISQSIKFSVNF